MSDHHFDVHDFKRFLEERPTYLDAENAPIYYLFRMDRPHLDVETTRVKLTYIDHIYFANIGAFVGKIAKGKLEGRSGVHWLAERLHKDSSFQDLITNAVHEPLTAGSIANAIEDVRRLVALTNCIVGANGRGMVSACSKYLHFHSGVHPVYDMKAATALHLIFSRPDWASILGDASREQERKKYENKLKDYAEFCCKFFELLRTACGGKAEFSYEVKQLDHYLYALHRRDWKVVS